MEIEQPNQAEVTPETERLVQPDFDETVDPLIEDLDDAQLVSIRYQARMVSAYFNQLIDEAVPPQFARDLTAEWMGICSYGPAEEEE